MLATLRDLKMSGGGEGKHNIGPSEKKNKGKQT